MEIRALRPGDDRSAFRSGDESLDLFFHRYAGQNQFRHHVGVTYVAVEDGRVLGFVTLAPRHVEVEMLPVRVRKALPRYPLSVLGIARLAVDRSAQGMGLGKHLLRFALDVAVRLSDEVGCVGVVVDAKRDAVAFYARYGFETFEAVEGQSDERPRPTPMWLPLRAVRKALQP